MAADSLKSLSITNLDATSSPFIVTANTTGVGAGAYLKEISDYVTPTSAGVATTGSTYKMVRLPVYAKVKSLELFADGQLDTSGSPALAFDVGAYWSDSAFDGTPQLLQGTLISANCFAAAATYGSVTGASTRVDIKWTTVDRNEPLWVALGLTFGLPNQTGAPPAGNIDVVLAVHTVAATGASANLGISVKYVV